MAQTKNNQNKVGNRHAVKHGLAASIRRDPEFADLVDALTALLAGNEATWSRMYLATRLADAVVAIQRLAATEIAMIEVKAAKQTAAASDGDPALSYAAALAAARPHLIKLERYKRAAFVNYLRTFRAYLLELEKEQFKT
jgi:hypothetical protein